jgi:hypothetical protein
MRNCCQSRGGRLITYPYRERLRMRQLSSTPEKSHGYRAVTRTLVTAATAAAFLGLGSLSASAAPGDVSTASVVANVNVNSTINLALDQASFDLNGTPNSTVTKTGAVTGRVTTNNATGYSVGVVAEAATLQPSLNSNADSIPIGDLEVSDAAGVSTPLTSSTTTPVITTTKATRSALAGDTFSDDYGVNIPDVTSDTYSVTLDYTATALA